MKLKCYYAHCTSIYNTKQETRDINTLKKLGFKVINPNSSDSDKKYKTVGMAYFLRLIESCDILAFRAALSFEIPAGISKEIEHAKNINLPVIELPTRTLSRSMSVEATREYLVESGIK